MVMAYESNELIMVMAYESNELITVMAYESVAKLILEPVIMFWEWLIVLKREIICFTVFLDYLKLKIVKLHST
jgi:hypothetical protein